MRLWTWLAIKHSDMRTDAQKAADLDLRERQSKALALHKRNNKKLEAKRAKDLIEQNVTNLTDRARKR